MTAFDESDDMCPNCVTPWKCNGPHLSDRTPGAIRERAAYIASISRLPRPHCRHIDPDSSVRGYFCRTCGYSLLPTKSGWFRHGDNAVTA